MQQICPSLKSDLVAVDPLWLAHWNRPVPRYTSYPTAPQFYAIDDSIAREAVKDVWIG